jgi:hypothetical protein
MKFYAQRSTTALFIIVSNQKPPKCPSTDEWIDTIWCSSFHGIPSSSKRNYNVDEPRNMQGKSPDLKMSPFIGSAQRWQTDGDSSLRDGDGSRTNGKWT